MADKPFRYPLDALLRKRRADWKTLKAEETTAGRLVDAKHADVGKAENTVAAAEEMLRTSCRAGMPIDPLQHHLVSGYLAQQRTVLKQTRQALVKAREVHAHIQANLEGVGRGVKSLEKHRAGKETDHRSDLNRLEQKRVDELWLLRRGLETE